MQIFCRDFLNGNKTLTFEVEPTTTIGQFREMYCRNGNYPLDLSVRFIHHSRHLEERWTMNDYNIKHFDTIHTAGRHGNLISS